MLALATSTSRPSRSVRLVGLDLADVFLGDPDDRGDDLTLSQTDVPVSQQGEQGGEATPVTRDRDVYRGARVST